MANLLMIDIHAHILPDVDDGSPNLATSLEMLRIAEESGTTDIIATPHVIEKSKALSWSDLLIRVQELQQRAKFAGLKIKIHPGAELEMNWDLLDLLREFSKSGSSNPYGLAGTEYILLELPGSMIPKYADEFLFELRVRGMIPIIAHPERHLMLMDQLEVIGRWRDAGVLVQCNSGSFTGLYGPTAKRNVEYLLDRGWVDFIGSDAHNSMHRNTCLSKCSAVVSELKGAVVAKAIMQEAGLKIINKRLTIKEEQPIAAIKPIINSNIETQPELVPLETTAVEIDNQEQVLINMLSTSSWDCKSSDKGPQDIDEIVVAEYFKRAQLSGRLDYTYTNAQEALQRLGFVRSGKMSNVAKLMFATNPGLEMQMAIFATNKRLTFNDIKRVQGNIPQLIAAAEKYIKNNIKWRVQLDGSMQRVEVPEIPLTAVREALVNSFCHRDYTFMENNEVSIYSDRIEIYSVGQFPKGLSPDDFIKGSERSVQRNPALAKVLYYSRDVESFGTGLKRITDVCRREKIKVEFKMLKNGFTVIIYRPNSEVEAVHKKNNGQVKFKSGETKGQNNWSLF